MLDLTFDDTPTAATASAAVPVSLPRKYLFHALGNDDYELAIDNSNLELFTQCDTAAYYRLILGRSTGMTAATVYGQAIHSALDVFYADKALDLPPDISRMLPPALAELAKAPSDMLGWRNEAQLTETLVRYIKKYSSELWSILDVESRPAVELPFRFDFGHIDINANVACSGHNLVDNDLPDTPLYVRKLRIVYTGRIDLIVEQAGKLWVVDHKTSSVGGPSYYEGFRTSSQFRGYCYIAGQLLGREVSGAFANVILARQPTKTGRDIEYERQPFVYDESLLAEWRHNTFTNISTFVARIISGDFPQRTTHCTNKFGTCPYLSVCALPPHLRPHLLYSGNYTEHTWNPLA